MAAYELVSENQKRFEVRRTPPSRHYRDGGDGPAEAIEAGVDGVDTAIFLHEPPTATRPPKRWYDVGRYRARHRAGYPEVGEHRGLLPRGAQKYHAFEGQLKRVTTAVFWWPQKRECSPTSKPAKLLVNAADKLDHQCWRKSPRARESDPAYPAGDPTSQTAPVRCHNVRTGESATKPLPKKRRAFWKVAEYGHTPESR